MVEAIAPALKTQSNVKDQTQLWLIPGKNITGDGIVIEIPGFIVDVLRPLRHEFNTLENTNSYKSKPMWSWCGCPIANDGLWNLREMEVNAGVKVNGRI